MLDHEIFVPRKLPAIRYYVYVYQIDYLDMNFDSLDKMLYYYEKNRIDPGFQDIGIPIKKEKYLEKSLNLHQRGTKTGVANIALAYVLSQSRLPYGQ